MSSETLENEKPQGEEKVQAEENTEKEDNSVKNDVDEKGVEKDDDRVEEEKEEEKKEEENEEVVEQKNEEVNDEEEEKNEEEKEEEEKNEEEKEEKNEEEEEEETEEPGEAKLNKSTKESGYVTPPPASERPTRERKTVDRYTVSSPDKFPRSSSSKALSIEKGNGMQLKDIPNVAFNLSKRKADDNLRALHSILFGKKAKANMIKRNIGLFSGYVWADNEEKLRAKTREKIDKCVREKLVDFCNVLNIPIIKTSMKKEELSAKLFEFLESPHATTDVLLADKGKKGKKRARKQTPIKSSGEAPAKKQKKTSQVGKKQKHSSDLEDSDMSEPSDAKVDSEDDVVVPKGESDHDDESMSEKEEEDKENAHNRSSKKALNEDQEATPVKKTTIVKTAKSTKKASKNALNDNTSKSKQSASKKQKTITENANSEGKVANKKQTDKSSKALVKDEGKGKSSEKKAKAGPSKKEMHRVVVDILKEVDFNKATLSDILKQLGTHFDVDLMHRKAEVKDIITDVINSMSDNEEASNGSNGGEDEDDA